MPNGRRPALRSVGGGRRPRGLGRIRGMVRRGVRRYAAFHARQPRLTRMALSLLAHPVRRKVTMKPISPKPKLRRRSLR